jgi:hypothetical protein
VACSEGKQGNETEGKTNGREQKERINIAIKEGNKIRGIKVISSENSEKKKGKITEGIRKKEK